MGCKNDDIQTYSIPKESIVTLASLTQRVDPDFPFSVTFSSDWRFEAPAVMQKAKAKLTGHNHDAIVFTAASFPGTVGTIASNINRWQGQLGLAPTSEDATQAYFTDMTLGKVKTQWVSLENNGRGFEIAVFMYDDATWFFKWDGPSADLTHHLDSFYDVVRSIRKKE